ncbi:hypothetical protein Mapa_013601 [Marchantia paleacea]|nr:hypothetical protein Mapa_013601 [Marchantia paleacea]
MAKHLCRKGDGAASLGAMKCTSLLCTRMRFSTRTDGCRILLTLSACTGLQNCGGRKPPK